jgi:O-antigen ligase
MLVYISPSAVRHTKEIIGYLVLFLVLTSLNSLHVIFEGLSTKIRVFGFAGVMISDYVGIAIIMNFILLLFSKKNGYRLLLILTFILFIVTLFVIQTRNAWISTFLCLFLLIIYLLFNAKKMEMRRSIPVIALLTSILFIGSVFLFVSSIKPEVTERLEQNKKLEETVDQSGQVQSSLIMRLMIWHTAYIAFSENPVLGIGAYSFPVSSYQYYKVPKLFFKKYIEGLSPHITYLAVATETGVIGLICFLIFLITSLKFSYDTLKYSKSFEDKAISLLLFWPLVYIALSMFMTDTWLWGQGIVLWGILLGFNMWNRKRIFRKINFN